MQRILLPTFLKLISQTTQEKARSYRRYDTPGGHDFYNSFKRAAVAITQRKQPLDEALQLISRVSQDVEREYNSEDLIAFHNWLGKKDEYFEPPKALYKSPSGILGVKLQPEIGRIHRGKRQIISIWNTRGVDLTATAAGVGVYMMEQRLLTATFADCSCHILDLTSPRLYGHGSVPNDPELYLTTEFAVAEALLKDEAA